MLGPAPERRTGEPLRRPARSVALSPLPPPCAGARLTEILGLRRRRRRLRRALGGGGGGGWVIPADLRIGVRRSELVQRDVGGRRPVLALLHTGAKKEEGVEWGRLKCKISFRRPLFPGSACVGGGGGEGDVGEGRSGRQGAREETGGRRCGCSVASTTCSPRTRSRPSPPATAPAGYRSHTNLISSPHLHPPTPSPDPRRCVASPAGVPPPPPSARADPSLCLSGRGPCRVSADPGERWPGPHLRGLGPCPHGALSTALASR